MPATFLPKYSQLAEATYLAKFLKLHPETFFASASQTDKRSEDEEEEGI